MQTTPLSLLKGMRESSASESWSRFNAIFAPLLHRWLERWNVPASDVDDLTQEILTAVVQEIQRFDHNGRTGAFRNWLKTVLRHRVLGFYRSLRQGAFCARATTIDVEEPESRLELTVEASEWDAEYAQEVCQRLLEIHEQSYSRTTWLAFRRQVVEGHSASQTAAELGVSVNAVLIAKSRVLRHLREESEGLLD